MYRLTFSLRFKPGVQVARFMTAWHAYWQRIHAKDGFPWVLVAMRTWDSIADEPNHLDFYLRDYFDQDHCAQLAVAIYHAAHNAQVIENCETIRFFPSAMGIQTLVLPIMLLEARRWTGMAAIPVRGPLDEYEAGATIVFPSGPHDGFALAHVLGPPAPGCMLEAPVAAENATHLPQWILPRSPPPQQQQQSTVTPPRLIHADGSIHNDTIDPDLMQMTRERELHHSQQEILDQAYLITIQEALRDAFGIKAPLPPDDAFVVMLRCRLCRVADADVLALPCRCLCLCRPCFAGEYSKHSHLGTICPACCAQGVSFCALEDAPDG